MDRSRVEQLLLEHVRPLANFLGLDEWTIHTRVGPLPEDDCANCWPLPEYRQATIVFDAEKTRSEDDFLDYLAHELFHAVLGPVNLYRNASRAGIGDEPKLLAANHESCRVAVEMTVSNLEIIWRRHLRDRYLDWVTAP